MRREFERLLQLDQRQVVLVREEAVLGMDNLLGHPALDVGQLLLHMREVVLAHADAYLRDEQAARNGRGAGISSIWIWSGFGPQPGLIHSLVHAVSGGGYPVLVDQSATAAVGAGESEEGGAPHRHLPGPTTEGRALTAHDPRLGTRQSRHSALCNCGKQITNNKLHCQVGCFEQSAVHINAMLSLAYGKSTLELAKLNLYLCKEFPFP